MEIPQIIKEAAREHGCNRVSYRGEIDGAKVFSIGCVDMNGLPIIIKISKKGKIVRVLDMEERFWAYKLAEEAL